MSIAEQFQKIKSTLPAGVTLIAVSKTQTVEKILEVYKCGQRIFGENKVQEMLEKYEQLPKDIEWHLIGHLQSNKVKYIAPFVKLIHSVDSLKLLEEINKQAIKSNRLIDCLLQIYIAQEETKFGLEFNEAVLFLQSEKLKHLSNIRIVGLMGMASNTDNPEQVKNEFHSLKLFFEKFRTHELFNVKLQELSMGMSSDYQIAIDQGSSMIRLGSSIFGERVYYKK